MVKVVIAEDDFRIAQVQEQFLQKVPGVKLVGKALNAKETMEVLEKEEVDLLLLDIYMPDELGTDLLPKIRDNHPTVDIIMVTAANDRTMLETAIRQGVFNYLLKPVTMEKFVETIEDYKRKKRLLNLSNEVDQSLIDRYFGKSTQEAIRQNYLPSGVDRLTLQKVKEVMTELKGGVSIEEMGEKMGASRTTARRYLEYLVSINVCIPKQDYGIVGRPERKYYLIEDARIIE
ncbi:response regulator [Metabacillus herbersteinensis]|uniref:Response regulator n=1 Tax=Metabacillus herbersteinensis TaxID=283816 RepID=A0ABV6GMV2_9BACI